MNGVALDFAASGSALAERFGGALDEGARDVSVDRLVSPKDAKRPSDLVLVTSVRWLDAARESPGVLLCTEALASRLPAGRRWAHSHPMWVVASLLEALAPRTSDDGERVRGVIERGAEVAPDARIAEGAVICRGARVGQGSSVGANAVVYGGVSIGARVTVGALAVLGRPGFGFTQAPDGSRIRVPQLGGVIVEDDVEIGPLCSIDAGTLGPTRIRRGAKLDAHVHVGHNVEVGEDTLVAAQAGFAGSAVIGSGVLVGGQAGVTDHARVGDGAQLGAKSGVVGDVPARAIVAGFPAVPRMRWLRGVAATLRPKARGTKR